MKLALILFSVLTSLSFAVGVQETPPATCHGRPLPITILPGPKMTSVSLPLRFGGERPMPLPWINSFPSKTAFRLVIKNRDEFSDFWKRFLAPLAPGQWVPPMPEVDFSKDMVVVAAMGERPMSGYFVIIDGACEVDGHVEVFVSNFENPCGGAQLQVVTDPADAVRIPQSNLPVVFRENQISCAESRNLMQRVKPTLKTWND
jgi:hypothetical protein